MKVKKSVNQSFTPLVNEWTTTTSYEIKIVYKLLDS
jgi:hypothetical protein